MKNIILLLCLLTLSTTTFAQNNNAKKGNNSESGIDFVIIEMKLGAILGGYQNGNFVNAEIASKGAKIGEDYTLFSLDVGENEGTLKLTKVHNAELDFCPEYHAVETNSKAKSGVALSSNARWNPTPRIPKSIDSNNKVYQSIVRDFIRSNGIKSPKVSINRILKVDLEGDGVDEVLIQARHRSKDNRYETIKGDYSFVMMRKLVNGKVENILLGGDFKKETRDDEIPYEFEFSSILDLDGDDKMEIVTFGSYYEGSWVEALQIKDGKAVSILNSGCGV